MTKYENAISHKSAFYYGAIHWQLIIAKEKAKSIDLAFCINTYVIYALNQ